MESKPKIQAKRKTRTKECILKLSSLPMSEKKIRLFLSHASEDKEDFVRPLRDELVKEGFDVWYDEDSLIVGQSLLQQISKGLKTSDYGIVVLSPHFFKKKWPQEELDGLFTLETAERKLIIPIWHNVTENEVKQYSAILAARFASVSAKGVAQVVADIKNAVTYAEREKEIADPIKAKFAAINRTAALNRKFQQLSRTEEGARLVWQEVSNLFSIFESKIAEFRGELQFPITPDQIHTPGYFIMVYGPEARDTTDGTRKTLTLRFDIRKISGSYVAEATLEERIYFEMTDFFSNEYRGMGLIDVRVHSPFFTDKDQAVSRDQTRSALSSAGVVTQALTAFGDFVQKVLEDRPITWNSVQPPGYVSPV